MDNLEWTCKGATLSDKTAQEEFGLTYDEIVKAIRAGRLQYRRGSIYGNPFLRLLRREKAELMLPRRLVRAPGGRSRHNGPNAMGGSA